MMYKSKSGVPITMTKWMELQGDEKYCRIRLEKLSTGIDISTVWIGKPGCTFETMVFDKNDNEVTSEPSYTIDQAWETHDKLAEAFRIEAEMLGGAH